MIEIHRSALVLAPAETLYQLINDIESYPAFLDGIAAAKVISSSQTEMLGQLLIRKAGMEKSIVTRNRLSPPERIEMTLEEGPLEDLFGVWTIKALNAEGCKVSLDLTFSSGSGLKRMAFNAMFKQVADSMVDAFVQRAQSLAN